MVDNVIPYIGGEEEKSEKEPLKLWGKIEGDEIVPADKPNFTAQCIRVPVSNGHLGAVFVNFEKRPTKDEMIKIWNEFICLSHNTLRGAAGGGVLLAELLCAEGYMD